jgi:multiple sugar transport system substrate-binding protein
MGDIFQGKLTRRRFLEVAGMGAAATVAVPGFLEACAQSSTGSATGSPKPATLSLYVAKDTARPQAQAQLFDMIKAKFEQENPGSSFTYDTYASAAEETTKLETSAAAQEGPDIFEFGSTLVPTAYATGSFEVFTNDMWNHIGGKSIFFPPQLTMSGPSPDKLIAVPVSGNPWAMVHNKAMFQAAGINQVPTTWSDFIAAAKEMTNGTDQWGTAMAPADGFDPWHKIWLFVTQLGGNLMDSTGKKGLLDSDASLEACAFWLDWMAKYKIAARQDAAFKGADEVRAFATGKIAFSVMAGPGGIGTWDNSPVAGQYEYTLGPTIPYGMSSLPSGGKAAQGFVSGQYYTLFKYSKNQELALNLLKVVVSPEIQYQYFNLRKQQPVVLETFSKYPELKQGNWAALYDAALKAYPTPFFSAWGPLEVELGKAINKIAGQIGISGSYTMSDLKAALTQVNQELQASLGA